MLQYEYKYEWLGGVPADFAAEILYRIRVHIEGFDNLDYLHIHAIIKEEIEKNIKLIEPEIRGVL